MALTPLERQELELEMEKREFCETTQKVRADIEDKSRYGNLTRYMNVQRRQQEETNAMQKRIEDAAFHERQLERETNLSRELDKIKRDEMKELLLRQQLRENSHELRDLERKLKAAYIHKALIAQMAEKEAEKMNEKIQEKRAQDILRTVWRDESELKIKLKQEDILKKAQYKRELQDQMILREKDKRYHYEEFLREKKMIDDIVQRIHDEDEREMQERMCKMKRTRDEMIAFKQARELWKKKKAEEIEEENRRIQEFLTAKAANITSWTNEREKRNIIKAKISEDIAKQIYEERAKKKEREDIIQELMELEKKEELERRDKHDMERLIRQRIEMNESLARQLKEKEERSQQEANEDARYKDEMLAKLAEDAKLEQMSQQKRRMRMLQLRRDVEQMMIDRRQKYAEEMQLSIKLKEQEDHEMEKRRQVIEEERIRMLKEHVKNLVGYLPKGLLTANDLPHLGADVVNNIVQNKNQC
ncbi:meiosis-specific nuclear structural protein 1-like [Anoplophora glabripennis]|uniref:meiosis-specific nuclear structural protein 1-like n=1 Tax=Anoplophora glabripennis TaxID=217634 RepID=UPI0008752CB5|nr:meiosis-specific nuclear structural protein 1-like [Anoplophora glabripennis]